MKKVLLSLMLAVGIMQMTTLSAMEGNFDIKKIKATKLKAEITGDVLEIAKSNLTHIAIDDSNKIKSTYVSSLKTKILKAKITDKVLETAQNNLKKAVTNQTNVVVESKEENMQVVPINTSGKEFEYEDMGLALFD